MFRFLSKISFSLQKEEHKQQTKRKQENGGPVIDPTPPHSVFVNAQISQNLCFYSTLLKQPAN